jgi:hypothetical protein
MPTSWSCSIAAGVVELGSHGELIARNGLYARLIPAANSAAPPSGWARWPIKWVKWPNFAAILNPFAQRLC